MIDMNKLLPCPFCGGKEFEITENGKVWTGKKYSEPTSVSVRHWCGKIEGQPSRMIERVGRDADSAVSAWNMRYDAKVLEDKEREIKELKARLKIELKLADGVTELPINYFYESFVEQHGLPNERKRNETQTL